MEKESEKRWAVDYSSIYPRIARVVAENKYLVFLEYSEDQSQTSAWNHQAVKRFDISPEAIKFLAEENRNHTKEELRTNLHRDFPKKFHLIHLDDVRDVD